MTAVTREGFNITPYYNAFGCGMLPFYTSISHPLVNDFQVTQVYKGWVAPFTAGVASGALHSSSHPWAPSTGSSFNSCSPLSTAAGDEVPLQHHPEIHTIRRSS